MASLAPPLSSARALRLAFLRVGDRRGLRRVGEAMRCVLVSKPREAGDRALRRRQSFELFGLADTSPMLAAALGASTLTPSMSSPCASPAARAPRRRPFRLAAESDISKEKVTSLRRAQVFGRAHPGPGRTRSTSCAPPSRSSRCSAPSRPRPTRSSSPASPRIGCPTRCLLLEKPSYSRDIITAASSSSLRRAARGERGRAENCAPRAPPPPPSSPSFSSDPGSDPGSGGRSRTRARHRGGGVGRRGGSSRIAANLHRVVNRRRQRAPRAARPFEELASSAPTAARRRRRCECRTPIMMAR